MFSNNSPLEHLAAFSIVFIAGMITTACMAKYMEKVRKNASQSATSSR